MSIRYRDSSGVESIVSGLTPGGDIEAGAVMTRSGTFSNTAVMNTTQSSQTINFDSDMPDADYILDIECNHGINYSVSSKTKSGFTLVLYAPVDYSPRPVGTVQFKYTATKTYTVQHAAETAEAVNTIQSLIPAGAGSTNQLTTKNYVDNADTALDGRVSDIEDLVPTGASVTNQLTTKAYVDEAIQHVEIDVDDELDSTSEDPVQNKVVKAAIDKKQDKVFVGTVEEWEELTAEEKAIYQLVNLTDDGETGTEDNYSTSEVNTGKKWIDGKPIYRKVYRVVVNTVIQSGYTIASSRLTGIQELLTTKEIVDMRCIIERTDSQLNYVDVVTAGPVTDGALQSFVPQLGTNGGYFGYAMTIKNLTIILEYTKTTD